MLGIDTNVLIRYIVQDDREQSIQATQFIESAAKNEIDIFISALVFCELVWVLESAYEYPKQSIVEVLEKILRTKEFFIHQSEILWCAFHDYKKLNVDFSGSYIAHLNVSEKCEYTATFDKKASRLPIFKLLGNKNS